MNVLNISSSYIIY